MFKRFKKNKQATCHAVAKGQLIDLPTVGDGVFSSKMLGDGFAIRPENSAVFSPVTGKVLSVFPTKHAITIASDDGLEILVHMGIDTVELKGVPFTIHVKEGDKVSPTTQLADMDLSELAKTETDSTVVVVVTNMDAVKEMPAVTERAVEASEEVLTLTLS